MSNMNEMKHGKKGSKWHDSWLDLLYKRKEMLEKEYSEEKTEKGNPQFKSGSGTIMLISDARLHSVHVCVEMGLKELSNPPCLIIAGLVVQLIHFWIF